MHIARRLTAQTTDIATLKRKRLLRLTVQTTDMATPKRKRLQRTSPTTGTDTENAIVR